MPPNTDTSMSFQPKDRINAVMAAARCDYGLALRLIDLYDLIAYLKHGGKDPSMNWLAENRGTSFPSIRRNATLMQKLGWLTFTTTDAVGTDWHLTGAAPTDASMRNTTYTMSEVTTNATLEVTTNTALEVAANTTNTALEEATNTTLEVTTNTALEETSIATCKQDGFLYGSLDGSNNQQPTRAREIDFSSPTSVFRGSSLREKTVERWNELKPDNFQSISSISPSRDRSIRALGGYQVFIDQLPAFFAGVKLNKFWSNTPGMSFEKILGSGVVPKAHFVVLSEAGQDSNQNTAPRSLEHPDFFPPVGKFADMRAKHNDFADEADAQRREDEAREFYTQQEPSK